MVINKEYATSAGHWYTKTGEPAYTVIGKNGKERATTLRDARQMNLVPSVTTILRCAAAPGLEQWKRQNLLMAAATLPRVEGESADEWIKRVEADASKQAADARDRGTTIHGEIEKAYLGLPFDRDYQLIVGATMNAVAEHFGPRQWSAEKSFASELGYGGKLDLSADGIVIDFKTSEFGPDDKKEGYDEHLMQLCAYGLGLFDDDTPYRAANVFVSTSHPGVVKIHEWSERDIQRGENMFLSILQFWQAKSRL